jgi:hypothetical protein
MADAINAKSDVLGERELDAVSGGMETSISWVASKVQTAHPGEGTSGGGQDPAAQQFTQLLQNLTTRP